MKNIGHFAAYAVFLMPVLWSPPPSFAESPFDGTWRIDFDESPLPENPSVFSLNNGIYSCSSCKPKIEVKADGRDQPVTGQPYDTVSAREIDPKSITITAKKAGRMVFDETMTVSDDGTTLMSKATFQPPSGQAVTEEETYTRVGDPPASGAHRVSGSWRLTKVKDENAPPFTYTSSGEELSMSSPLGESWTAKLDGKDYPVKGSDFIDSVALKRISERTIEETDKLHGKAVEVQKMTVSPDGKKLTTIQTDPATGRTSTIVAVKQ